MACLLAATAPDGGTAPAGQTVTTRAAAFPLGATGLGGKGQRPGTLQTGPMFNAPQGRAAKRDRIANQISRLITGAPEGATIAVGMYHFSSLDTAAELAAAARRGVHVRVVLDHESTAYTAYRRLRRALGENTGRSSWVIVCGRDRGCIGPQFNHNKFLLFSSTLGSTDVVVQTSANATDGARDTQWNDALTIEDDQVYAAYLRYFDDLAAQHHTANYHRTVRAGAYRLDFFPWSSGDPISAALDKVSCAGGTRLRLNLGHFTWGPIAKRLWKLDDAGCRVQVIFDRVGRAAIRDLTKRGGRHGNPEIRYLSENCEVYAHSKYLLIDGRYDGTPQKIVFTGSNNYTTVGFHGHDEAMITIADARWEDLYAANFAAVFARGHVIDATDATSVPQVVLEPNTADGTTGRVG